MSYADSKDHAIATPGPVVDDHSLGQRGPGRRTLVGTLQRRANGDGLANASVGTTTGASVTPEALQWKLSEPAGESRSDGLDVGFGAEADVARAGDTGGSPLPARLQHKFESSLGADLGNVRIHDGQPSQTAAASVGARAYTLGQDVHFGAGEYSPDTAAGEHLLAHEVAHTVQQSGGATNGAQFKLQVSTPGDASEVAADRAADAMVAGTLAGALSSAPSIMHRQTFQNDLVHAGGDGPGTSVVGTDKQGHDVLPTEQGFSEWMLKESGSNAVAMTAETRLPMLQPNLSDFGRISRRRALESRWCQNLGSLTPPSIASQQTTLPSATLLWDSRRAWCEDHLGQVKKDQEEEARKFQAYNGWTSFANAFAISQARLETQAVMLGGNVAQAGSANAPAFVGALLAGIHDAKEVMGNLDEAKKLVDPSKPGQDTDGANVAIPELATDAQLASSTQNAILAFNQVNTSYLRFLQRSAIQQKKAIDGEGVDERKRLEKINQTKDAIKLCASVAQTTMGQLAGAPAKIGAASDLLGKTGAQLNQASNTKLAVKGQLGGASTEYMAADKEGNIVVKSLAKDSDDVADSTLGFDSKLPVTPVAIVGVAVDFIYKAEVDKLNGVLTEIKTRCAAQDVAAEFLQEWAAAEDFQNTLAVYAKACADFQARMLKRRDEYQKFGAQLDLAAKQNKASKAKGLAPGKGQERFATIMTLVSSVRELLSLGNAAQAGFDSPAALKGFIQRLHSSRASQPPMGEIAVFAIPDFEGQPLQGIYDNVVAFSSWNERAHELFSGVESAAGELVGKSTGTGALQGY